MGGVAQQWRYGDGTKGGGGTVYYSESHQGHSSTRQQFRAKPSNLQSDLLFPEGGGGGGEVAGPPHEFVLFFINFLHT